MGNDHCVLLLAVSIDEHSVWNMVIKGWLVYILFWVHIKYSATTFDYAPPHINIAYIGSGIWGISEGCNSFGCIIEARTKKNMLFLWWQVIHDVDTEDVLAEHIQQQTKWDHSRVEHTWLTLLMRGSPYKAIAFLKQPSTIPQISTSRKAFPFISIWDLEN